MEQITKDFYEKYLEFEDYLEFRMFDLEREFEGRNVMFSKYARNIEEVEQIMKDYDNPRYIVYVGCNTRPTKSRKDVSVKFRRTFFLDIEADGDKPPLTDKVYYKKLLDTALYIWNKFREMKIEPNLLLESGRGLHVGIKMIPLSTETYDDRFVLWYRDLIKDLKDGRPHKDIKFDDSMYNLSRIQSAPGFAHNKYPEKPRRNVLKLYTNENNLLGHLNRKKVFELKKKKSFPNFRRKYNDITFYKSPEWLLISENKDLPEGEIHNKILFMIKILARDNDLDRDLLQERVRNLGYDEVIDEPPEDAVYSPWVLFNWAMRHYDYCYTRNIVVPFPYEKHVSWVKGDSDDCPNGVRFPIRKIESYRDLITYIRDFNGATSYMEGEKMIVYFDLMWNKISKGIENENLMKYIEFLKLKDFISCEMNYVNIEEKYL